MNEWRQYLKSLNEIEAYQKAVRRGYVAKRNQYLDTGPEDPGPAYPLPHEKDRAQSAAPGFGGALEEECDEDEDVLEEEEDGISTD